MNIKYELRYSRDPDPDEILKTLETAKLEPNMRRALQAKYDAMTAPTTELEKTMTSEQLKALGHPAWARNHTVETLRLYFIAANNDASYDMDTTLANYHPHDQRTDDVLRDYHPHGQNKKG